MVRLFLGGVCIGFAPIFVRLVTLGPTPIGAYRCGFAALLLFIYIFATSKLKIKNWSWKIWGLLLQAGAIFALDLFVWHRSVIYSGAGLATILGNTQVFYVTLVGVLFHKEKLTPKFALSVLLA